MNAVLPKASANRSVLIKWGLSAASAPQAISLLDLLVGHARILMSVQGTHPVHKFV